MSGRPTTLKRSGSDYSATIFGRLLEAATVTFWKNVSGVYTADPRKVPEAFPIDSMRRGAGETEAFRGFSMV